MCGVGESVGLSDLNVMGSLPSFATRAACWPIAQIS